MKQTTFKTDSPIFASMALQSLSVAMPVIGSWVDKNGPLNKSGIFFDFKRELIFIRKSMNIEDSYAGMMEIPFAWRMVDNADRSALNEYTMVVTLHKLSKVLQWASQSSTDLQFEFSTTGAVYVNGHNNKVQLNAEWYAALDDNESPFSEYKTSTIGVIESLRSAETQFNMTAEHELTSEKWLQDLLDVGRIESNLRFVAPQEMPETLTVANTDAELELVNTAQNYALSYARMSLFLKPLAASNVALERKLYATDRSVPTAFYKDLQAIVDMMKQISASTTLKIQSYSQEDSQTASSIDIVSLSMLNARVFLTIPSAAVMGMAPPSSDDLQAILPDLSQDEASVISLPYSELKRTLQFWDSLQRIDGKDIVTPLKPITFNLDERTVTLSVNSADGVNEASFEVSNSLNSSWFSRTRVPFDTLLRIITSPLFESDDEYVTLSRPATDEAAVLLIYRNSCIAAIAEFV